MLLRLFAFALFSFFFNAHVLALGSKIIKVRPLPDASGLISKTNDVIPLMTDFSEISDDVLGIAYYDQKNIYLALMTEKGHLARSLVEIGLRFRIRGSKKQEIIMRLQPTAGNANFQRPLRIASGVEPLLPKNVNDRLKAFMPSGEYAAYLLSSQGRMGVQLFVPDFDALFQDSTSMLVLRIPLSNPLYPDHTLPFDKRGKLKMDFEIGEEFFTRAFISRPGNAFPGRNRQRQTPLNSTDNETPRFAYDKFSIELVLEDWSGFPNNKSEGDADFNLKAYVNTLDEWTARSGRGRGGAFGSRGGRGAAPGLPPISVTALFASPKVVNAGIAYVSTFLRLSKSEQEQIYHDFNTQWQTGSYFPVLVTLRTNMHKSYLNLSRWTIFLEDDNRTQYEAVEVIDVTDSDPRTGAKSGVEENKITRPVFSSLVKEIVMLFPRRDHDDKPIWEKSNRKFKLVILSNEHIEQRLEMEWRVPK
ncbi:MAG: hypothetical protein ACE5I1_24965 [bacterium]